MKTGRIFIIFIIVIAAAVTIRLVFFGKKEMPDSKKGPHSGKPAVSGYVVHPAVTSTAINASGSLVSSEEVVLRSETSGKIIMLNIREGSRVTKGELLVKMNDDDLVATQRKLQSRLSLAKQRLERQKTLLASKAIGQEEYDISSNEVSVLEADLEYNTALIRKTEIRAPFSGIIGLKNVSEGSYIIPSVEISVIHQVDPLKLDFSIPERYAGSIQVGDRVNFTVDGNTENYSAKVTAIEPKVDPATRTVKIRALASNPGNRLFPGSFARVNLPLEKPETMMIPTQSVIPVLKGKKVFVTHDGMAVSRQITTGERSATMIEVLDGLMAGDTVITTGIMQLRDSMMVQVRVTD